MLLVESKMVCSRLVVGSRVVESSMMLGVKMLMSWLLGSDLVGSNLLSSTSLIHPAHYCYYLKVSVFRISTIQSWFWFLFLLVFLNLVLQAQNSKIGLCSNSLSCCSLFSTLVMVSSMVAEVLNCDGVRMSDWGWVEKFWNSHLEMEILVRKLQKLACPSFECKYCGWRRWVGGWDSCCSCSPGGLLAGYWITHSLLFHFSLISLYPTLYLLSSDHSNQILIFLHYFQGYHWSSL